MEAVTARLNEPNTLFLDTVNQLDLSFSKSFKAGAAAFRPEVALFNALNANPVTAQTNAFGPALDRAAKSDTVALLDIVTDPKAYPPVTLYDAIK